MTRDEFLKNANKEIDDLLTAKKNRILNVIEQAWAEGKRNAEVDALTDVIKNAVDRITDSKNKNSRSHDECFVLARALDCYRSKVRGKIPCDNLNCPYCCKDLDDFPVDSNISKTYTHYCAYNSLLYRVEEILDELCMNDNNG